MTVRRRAIQAGEKRARCHAILDAAERLLLQSPDRNANMAEVAREAGLAKGTVYLYFPGKEELLLALHERNLTGYFHALIALLDDRAAVSIEDLFDLTRTRVLGSPSFLPLASRCFGGIDQKVPVAARGAFQRRMAAQLELAGAGLERHFAALKAGDGVELLRQIYALILGMWLTAGSASVDSGAWIPQANSAVAVAQYTGELGRALYALWEGSLARARGRARH